MGRGQKFSSSPVKDHGKKLFFKAQRALTAAITGFNLDLTYN
jgi:hypothetical protein